jgi:hypothetical protein
VLNRFGVKSAANLKDEEKRTGKKPKQGFSSSSSSEQQDAKRPGSRKRAAGKKKKQRPSLSSSSEASSQCSSGSGSSSSSSSRRSRAAAEESGTSLQVKGPPPEIEFSSRRENDKKPAKSESSQSISAAVGTGTSTPSAQDQNIPKSLSAVREQTGTKMPSPSQPIPANTVVTEVNVDRPEANREVMIFRAKDIVGAKDELCYFFGYVIVLPIDIRHIMDDDKVEWFRARVYTHNQVLLSYPAYTYALLNNREEIEAGIHKARMDPVIFDAIDDGRINFEDRRSHCEMNHILLKFPYDHHLSASDIYANAGEDEELEMKIFPVEYKHEKMRGTNIAHFASFTVARTDTKPYKKGKMEQKQAKSKGAQLLNTLYGNDIDDVDDDDMS